MKIVLLSKDSMGCIQSWYHNNRSQSIVTCQHREAVGWYTIIVSHNRFVLVQWFKHGITIAIPQFHTTNSTIIIAIPHLQFHNSKNAIPQLRFHNCHSTMAIPQLRFHNSTLAIPRLQFQNSKVGYIYCRFYTNNIVDRYCRFSRDG